MPVRRWQILYYIRMSASSANAQKLLVILILTLSTPATLGEDDTNVEAQLEQIDQQLNSLNSERISNRDQVAAYQQQIQDFDEQIATASKRSHDLSRQVEQLQLALDQLSSQDQDIIKRISQQQKTLATHIQMGWLNRLNHGLLGDLGDNNERLLKQIWLEYLSNQQKQTLRILATENSELEKLQQQQQKALNNFNKVREAESIQRQTLQNKKSERQASIQNLNQEFKATGIKIDSLEQDRAELAEILMRLKAARDDTAFIEKGTEFESLKGSLPWPHQGKITGKRTDPGLTIQADNGDPVAAIAAGRVAYAEWLKGFGLLLIIDHGKGYMTLYGNNESLYRKTGDWVEQGDVLSAAGQSGGRSSAGLYFEIRADGKSVNARDWCTQ